ncbi:hypothetical protein BG015_008827 [Linnemannia schmuckeri]|uniref:Uncharacterized protein n=1 Tax=Linnemannia schmuckeri TaxID=64567 RepID=A0A9P5RZV6_9FUNG|nr:hypothetical protein BG015_008827 [Linnemannia schmuckeri]
MSPLLYGLRLWLVLFTFVNFTFIMAFYAWDRVLVDKMNADVPDGEKMPIVYVWDDYAVITSSVVLFVSNAYSVFGKKPLVQNRFPRAFLMLIPKLFLLGYQLHVMHGLVRASNEYGMNQFSCSFWSEELVTVYGMRLAYFFLLLFTGFFTVVEMFVPLIKGPAYPPKDAHY